MPWIQVHTFGGVRVVKDGLEVSDLPGQPVRCALLVYLAVQRSASRDELARLLWPDSDDDRARRTLSQTLYELRKQLGDAWYETPGDRIELTNSLECDADVFDSGDDLRIIEAYRGEFLSGLALMNSAALDRWVEQRRAYFARKHREACRRRVAQLLADGETADALAAARDWVQADPFDDEGQHQLIELLAVSGRRSEALRQFDDYAALVSREMDVEPLPETIELVERIREEGVSRRLEGRATSRSWVFRKAPADQGAPTSRFRTGVRVAGIGLLLVMAAFFLWPQTDESESDGLQGIAVLPFANLSDDPEQEYFSDGITEDVLTALSRIDGLRVISRTSTWRYKGESAPIAGIARDLGVEYVVEGSVRRENERVRVTAQLVHAPTDTRYWAESYDRSLTSIFELQSEIASEIARALEKHIPSAEGAAISARAVDVTAYDLLLRGRDYLRRPGDADPRKYRIAGQFFREALTIDPSYAEAHAALSDLYRRDVTQPIFPLRRDSMMHYAERAVELDPTLASAQTALGYAWMFSEQRVLAREAFRRALQLAPNESDALTGLARLSVLEGRLDDAIRWNRDAVAIDPQAPELHLDLGRSLFDIGDLAGARSSLESAVRLAPDHPEANLYLAYVHDVSGDRARAEAQIDRLVSIAGDHPSTPVAEAMYLTHVGDYERASAILAASPFAEFGAIRMLRGLVERRLGNETLATDLLDGNRRLFDEWDAAGYPVPIRGRLHLQIFDGDFDAALETLRRYWPTGLRWIEDPPEVGVYFLDRQAMLRDLHNDPRFYILLGEIRTELDRMRSDVL
jgi:TolB-like protein/DNA-binding SARP family transcriptional activator/Flp pilus assembly protein TadD